MQFQAARVGERRIAHNEDALEDTGLVNVELHVPRVDAKEKGSELREALLQIPGVHSVGAMSLDEVSVLAHVTVGYDPALTNPIVIRDELGRSGFSVVSAAEETD